MCCGLVLHRSRMGTNFLATRRVLYCTLVMYNSYNVTTLPSFLHFVSLYTRNYSLAINQWDSRCLFLVANSFVCFIISLILSCLFSVCLFSDRFCEFNLTRHWKQDLITCPIEVCWLLPMGGLCTLRIPQEREQRKMSRPEKGNLSTETYCRQALVLEVWEVLDRSKIRNT